MKITSSFFAFALLLCFFQNYGQTSVGGSISANTTWSLSNSPYTVTSSVSVASGAILTIESGVEVKFNSNTNLTIQPTSSLTANNVIFTSSQPSPNEGDWQGLSANGNITLTGCQILYARDGISVNDADITLTNTSILNSSEDGIYAVNNTTDGTNTINADNLTITGTGSGYRGIYAEKTILNITNSSISDVGTYAVYLNGIRSGNESIITGESSISNTTLSNGSSAGIHVINSAKLSLAGNTISNNGYAISYGSSSDITFPTSNTFTANSFQAINYTSSTITTDMTLDAAGIPYKFGNVEVQPDVHFTINPGVIIKFTFATTLSIKGKLTADGTPSLPITFTSYSDDNTFGDTNANGSNNDANAEAWVGIIFQSTSDPTSIIDNAIIRWAKYTTNCAGIICKAASPVLTNNTISNSYFGARFEGDSNPTFTGNTIGSSSVTPISMSFEADPIFSNNAFSTSDNEYDAIGLIGGTSTANATIIKRDFTDVPNITYVLLESITVPSGRTLSIESGVVIKALSGQYLNIEGTLTSPGNESESVVFTSVNDDNFGNPNDTRNDGNNVIPIKGNFGGIYFAPTSGTSSLDYTLIKFANYTGDFDPITNSNQPYNSAIAINSADISISNSRITDCDFGITFRNSDATVTNNEFVNTTSAPFRMSLSSNPVFSNNNYNSVGWKGISILPELVTYTASLDKRDVAGIINTTYINEGFTIANGANLTINAGLVIKSKPYVSIYVNGGLKVNGTANEPVIFTALADDNAGASAILTNNDTEGNGNATDPNTTKWGGIIYTAESDDSFSGIDHAEFLYGGGQSYDNGIYLYAPIGFNNASAPLSNIEILYSQYYGLYLNNYSNPIIDQVLIQSSAQDPIALSFFSNPVFSNMTFDANGSNGLKLIETTLSSNATVIKRNIAGINNIAYILGNLEINSGAILTVNPGVVFKLPNSNLNVYEGAIKAIGTPSEKIIFTSVKDDSRGGDTNNDGNGTVPIAGDWGGIDTYTSSVQSVFDYCEFRYGRNSTQAGFPYYEAYDRSAHITSVNNATKITNSLIQLNSANAIGIYGTSTATIENNKIENICTTCTPVHMSMFANPTMSGNTVENIGYFAIGIRNETFTQSGTFPFRSFAGVDNITYVIDQLTVSSGTHITIPAGMIFKSSSYDALTIEGQISISGTEAEPVIFTSIDDDEYGRPLDTQNNGLTNPTINPYYNWIIMKNISDDASVIDHAIFRYRQNAISLISASPTISNNKFEYCTFGINSSGLSEPDVLNNTFKDLQRAPYITSLVAWPTTLSGNVIEGTTWKGIQIQDETLTQDTTLVKRAFAGVNNIPYIFHIYTVGTGVKMSIDPGVVLKFVGYYTYAGGASYMNIKGALAAAGGYDADSTIIFTSILDDFHGGRTYSSKTPDQYAANWQGITFENESSDSESILKHTVVKKASVGVRLNSASPTFENVSFQENRNWGLQITGASNPSISSCDFLDNGYDTNYYGSLENTGSFQVNAQSCWWGDNSGPKHATLNPTGLGNMISGDVIFDPWATNNSLNPRTGDISLNGHVSAYDAALGLQAVAQIISLNSRQLIAGDASGNDEVSAMDASYILQYSAGMISYFPAEAENRRIQENWATTFSNIKVSLPDVEIDEQTSLIELPISINNVNELYAFETVLKIDEAFDFVGFEQTGWNETKVTTNFIAAKNELHIAFAGASPKRNDTNLGTIMLQANTVITKPEMSVTFERLIGNETNVLANSRSSIIKAPFNILANESDQVFDIYPNPASDYLDFNFKQGETHHSISLLDVSGKVITQFDLINQSKFRLTLNSLNLKNGIYIIKIDTDEKSIEKRIVINQ